MRTSDLWTMVHSAWAMIAPGARQEVAPPRPRGSHPSTVGDEPNLDRTGFAEEALPWLDAVYRFALRLTRGDVAQAEDLVQETFLRAHRSWGTFRRGTNARSWLFTICRNTHLHDVGSARARRERPEADFAAPASASRAAVLDRAAASGGEPDAFFDRLIDDDILDAVDRLNPAFRDVLVLSDLGDLTYAEIAAVLDLPVGTVKSRLFRARAQLRTALAAFASRSGHLQEDDS